MKTLTFGKILFFNCLLSVLIRKVCLYFFNPSKISYFPFLFINAKISLKIYIFFKIKHLWSQSIILRSFFFCEFFWVKKSEKKKLVLRLQFLIIFHSQIFLGFSKFVWNIETIFSNIFVTSCLIHLFHPSKNPVSLKYVIGKMKIFY